MRSSAAVIAMLLALGGCSLQSDVMSIQQRRDILPAFRQGRTVLTCRAACSWQWITNRQTLNALYAGQQWDQLAGAIASIGYQQDLAYYWLGRAAEGENYLPAAARYYAIAGALTRVPDTSLHCGDALVDGCFGIDVAAAASTRLAAVQGAMAALNQPAPYRGNPYAPMTAPAEPRAPAGVTPIPFDPAPAPPPSSIPGDGIDLPPIRP